MILGSKNKEDKEAIKEKKGEDNSSNNIKREIIQPKLKKDDKWTKVIRRNSDVNRSQQSKAIIPKTNISNPFKLPIQSTTGLRTINDGS